MSEEQKPTAPSPEKPGISRNIIALPLAEKIVTALALVIIVGWIFTWAQEYGWTQFKLFSSWFATLSFLGALAVATLVILKVFNLRPLPRNIERHVIPCASVLPAAGLLILLAHNVSMFMITGASLALVYVSLTTYWGTRIPRISMARPDEEQTPENKAEAAGPSPTPPAPADSPEPPGEDAGSAP